MFTKTQLKDSIVAAANGERVMFICPTRSRASHVMCEIENLLVGSKATGWKIFPGRKTMEIGAGMIMVKSLKDGNGYLRGLRVEKVYLDDCWIEGLV